MTDKNLNKPIIVYENLHLSNREFESSFKDKVARFLDKGWYILGEEVRTFEDRFASYCGAKYCIGVANGLDALELSLTAFDFPKNAEIIVPSNTYIATILAIINAGYKPVLVEPDITTYNLDPSLIEAQITLRTKAILVVHLYGRAAKIDPIMNLSKMHGLEIIEDCAQAHGAVINGKMVGTFGRMGAFSFYPTKNLGAVGDAGAIITSDDVLYERLKAMRNYGSERKYYNKYIGRNSRLDELQAAFLNIKLPSLENINEHKRQLANIYDDNLTSRVIKPPRSHEHVYHIYNIRTEKRDNLKSYLEAEGIETVIHYPIPPHRQEGYLGYFKNQTFPISEEIHASTLSLPISYATSKMEVHRVCEVVNHFFS